MMFKGKTALITGASSGIGLAYAKELAKRGTNLILVARRKDLLEAAQGQIQRDFGVAVNTIDLDLSYADSGQKLIDAVKKLGQSPDILINNAGFGTNNLVAAENRDRIRQEITLNITTLVDLTAAYLPSMLEKNDGVIVNIGSTASFQPVPGMAVYSATKAFVRSFTSAVWGEVAGTKVRVLTVNPGATATEFFDVAGANPAGALAPMDDVVKATFKALDSKKTQPSIIVGGRNSAMANITKFLPSKLVIKVAGSMFIPKKDKN